MSRKIEYSYGDVLNKHGTIFIEEIKTNSGEKRKAKFKCPYCSKIFSAVISSVKRSKNGSCGCIRKPPSQNGNFKYKEGDKIGPYNIELIERLYSDKNYQWHCKFLCPEEHKDNKKHYFISTISSVSSGNTRSCGCLNNRLRPNRIKDLTGQKFGYLTVIEKTNKRCNRSVIWKCRCNNCNRITYITSRDLTTNNTKSCGCVQQKSFGEEKIKEQLQLKNIRFYQQYSFNDCINPKTNRKLRFDFYLPEYNCCIEYDGQQHYEPNDFFGGEKGLIETQYRDQIKNQYCKNNNIKLIRIPYWNYTKINEECLWEDIFKC